MCFFTPLVNAELLVWSAVSRENAAELENDNYLAAEWLKGIWTSSPRIFLKCEFNVKYQIPLLVFCLSKWPNVGSTISLQGEKSELVTRLSLSVCVWGLPCPAGPLWPARTCQEGSAWAPVFVCAGPLWPARTCQGGSGGLCRLLSQGGFVLKQLWIYSSSMDLLTYWLPSESSWAWAGLWETSGSDFPFLGSDFPFSGSAFSF